MVSRWPSAASWAGATPRRGGRRSWRRRLAVFAAQGFAAAKLDDVAEKAGVAKGTIYLHFKDKQDLFEQMVRDAVSPVIARLEALAKLPDLPADMVLQGMFDVFRTEVLGTRRKDSAAPRHDRRPALSRHCRVLSPRGGVARAEADGRGAAAGPGRKASCRPRASPDFPQLVVAPLILAVVWDGLFAAIEPLDVRRAARRLSRLLLRGKAGTESGHEARCSLSPLLPCSLAAGGGAWWWFDRPPAAGPLVLTGNVEVRQVNLGFKVGGPHPEPQGRRGRQHRRGPDAGAAGEGLLRGQHRAAQGPARPGQGQPAPRWRPATGRRRSRRPRPP